MCRTHRACTPLGSPGRPSACSRSARRPAVDHLHNWRTAHDASLQEWQNAPSASHHCCGVPACAHSLCMASRAAATRAAAAEASSVMQSSWAAGSTSSRLGYSVGSSGMSMSARTCRCQHSQRACHGASHACRIKSSACLRDAGVAHQLLADDREKPGLRKPHKSAEQPSAQHGRLEAPQIIRRISHLLPGACRSASQVTGMHGKSTVFEFLARAEGVPRRHLIRERQCLFVSCHAELGSRAPRTGCLRSKQLPVMLIDSHAVTCRFPLWR